MNGMNSHSIEPYDIIVVGAGPAGASAAAEAARRKARVLMVEKSPVVGIPVQCAEYIPAQLVGELNLNKSYIVQSVRGMRTYLGKRIIKESPIPGFMIDRKRLDQMLVEEACREGADILLATKALSRNGNEVTLQPKSGLITTITAKIIIGADGPLSTVGKWINAVNRDPMPAVQVIVPLLRRQEFTEVYFDPEIYAGYAWLFPKGNQANLGLGMKKTTDSPAPLGKLLEKLLVRLTAKGKIENKPLERISGWIPCNVLEKIIEENVLLTGDAAGHTHPITGAGIFPAITCGRMAGKWAARAIAEDNLQLLAQYKNEYDDLFGDSMNRAVDRRRLMESQWHRLPEIIEHCWVVFKEYYVRTD